MTNKEMMDKVVKMATEEDSDLSDLSFTDCIICRSSDDPKELDDFASEFVNPRLLLCYEDGYSKRVDIGAFDDFSGQFGIINHIKDSLTALLLPDSLREIGSFMFCKNLRYVSLPKYLEKLTSCAFNGCSSLTSITIPFTVTDIKERAFTDCPLLKKIILYPELPPSIPHGIFSEKVFSLNEWEKYPDMYVPTASLEAYRCAPGWKKYKENIHPIEELHK